jgi:hypothetical protein
MFAVGDKFAEVLEGVYWDDCLREIVSTDGDYVKIRYSMPKCPSYEVHNNLSRDFVESRISEGCWVKV